MYQEKPDSSCGGKNGMLPGSCGAMVFPFVAMQTSNPEIYPQQEALANGTLFPGLNLPFHKAMQSKMSTGTNPALCELMALDFAMAELGLYLDTHQDDKEAFALFQKYARLAKEGRERYEKMYGPLKMMQAAEGDRYNWPDAPWPWEMEGGKR